MTAETIILLFNRVVTAVIDQEIESISHIPRVFIKYKYNPHEIFNMGIVNLFLKEKETLSVVYL